MPINAKRNRREPKINQVTHVGVTLFIACTKMVDWLNTNFECNILQECPSKI